LGKWGAYRGRPIEIVSLYSKKGYENNFPTSTWEKLKVAFKKRYQTVKIDEGIYQKMCAIHVGQEEDVEAYYK
jgi:hypothetical protein